VVVTLVVVVVVVHPAAGEDVVSLATGAPMELHVVAPFWKVQ
jgi:hypothetical protein